MSEATEYDLSLAEKPVNLKQTDGTVKQYTLRELPGDELEAYMEENKDRMDTVVEGGKIVVRGVRSYKGMFTSLLKRALHNDQGKKVPVEEIKTFPARVQQALFKDAQKLSALETVSEEEAGN
jgi:hypothetical protein